MAPLWEAGVLNKVRKGKGGCRQGYFNAALVLQGLPQEGPSCLEVGAWEPC